MSTMRCAAHRCMLRTSEPNVTAVSSVCTVAPRRGGRRPVEEHQEDAGDGEQDEQEERQAAEAQRVRHLHRVPLHLHRVKVVQHVVHDHVGAVPGAVGVALAEDRAGPEDRRSTPASCATLSPIFSTRSRELRAGAAVPVARRCRWPRTCLLETCDSEPHAVRVAVSVGADVGVAVGDVGWSLPRMITPVGQRSTHSAHRVQMSSSTMNATWSRGSSPGCSVLTASSIALDRHHVDALPRADVDAALAEDALGLVDVEELLRLHRAGEVRRVDLLQLVVGREVGHRRVRVGAGHQASPPFAGRSRHRRRRRPARRRNGRPKRDVRGCRRLAASGFSCPRFCHTANSARLSPKNTT